MLLRTKLMLVGGSALALLLLGGGSASASGGGEAPAPPGPLPNPTPVVPPVPLPPSPVPPVNAQVLGTGVRLRAAPTTNSAIVATLTQGERVTVPNPLPTAPGNGSTMGWVGVVRSDGRQGWVASEFLGDYQNL